jgi:hypothetical protein
MKEYEKDQKNIRHNIESTRKKILDNICTDRVKEGQFINDSLDQLRSFISYFVTQVQNKDSTNLNPKFIDACAPIQCNPNYEECFGNNVSQSADDNILEKSVIALQIKNKICCSKNSDSKKDECEDNCSHFNKLTFCIFNVINLSQKANNPPPVPYIDITNLTNELTRLESLKYMLSTNNVHINDNRSSTLVYKPYLEELKDSQLLSPNYTGSIKGTQLLNITSQINVLIQQHLIGTPPLNPDVTIYNLKNLIVYINKINSLSTIGTMEFTDMIAKFGLNRSVCNYKYKYENDGSITNGTQITQISQKLEDYKQYINNLYTTYSNSIISN